jgi:hypothetical protein
MMAVTLKNAPRPPLRPAAACSDEMRRTMRACESVPLSGRSSKPMFLITVYAKKVQKHLDQKQRKAAKALTDAIRAQFGR